MSFSRLLFLPALVIQAPAPEPAAPPLQEARSGVYTLRGVPGPGTYAELKRMRFGAVLDLRRDEDVKPGDPEQGRLADLGITYVRYAVPVAISTGDLDFLRQLIHDQAKAGRVLVHCDDGNRASAAVCAWLVLDKHLKRDEALKLAHDGGLRLPATEAALARYLDSKG